jgi:hypothetical protein
MRLLSLLLAGSISTSAAGAADWKFHEDGKTGRQAATSTVTGTGPGGAVKATLVIHHPHGMPLKVIRKGNATELPIILELCVDHFETVKGFDFLKFEGPDAPAADKALVTIMIEAADGHFSKRFTQGGWINHLAWLLPDEKTDTALSPKGSDDFTFGIGDAIKDLKDFIAISRLLQKSPTKIEVIVTDSKDPKRTLHFSFPTSSAADVIGKVMR